MIKDRKSLSMAESMEYVQKSEDAETDVIGFIKKFVKLNPKQGKELRKKLEELELMKLKQEQMVKIIDILPEYPEELNKIFGDTRLDEDETKKILETVKEFK